MVTINIPNYIVKIVIHGSIPLVIKELFEHHEIRTLTGALYERYRLNKPGKVFNIGNKDIQLILHKSTLFDPSYIHHARIYFFNLNDRKGYKDIGEYYSLKPRHKTHIPPKYLQTVIGLIKEPSQISQEERDALKNNIMIDYYELDSDNKNSLEEIITNIITQSYTSDFFLFKICCMGLEKKTELIRYVTTGKFTTSYLPTLGVDITTKRINTGGIISKLIVVDTAGQQFFGKLRPSYYRGASVGIIFIDADNPEALKQIKSYEIEFRKHTSKNIPLYVARLKLKDVKWGNRTLNQVVEESGLQIINIKNPRHLKQLFEDLTFNLLMK